LLAGISGVVWLMASGSGPEAAGVVEPPRETSSKLTLGATEELDQSEGAEAMIEDWIALREWLKSEPSAERVRAKLMAMRERWVVMDGVVLAQVLRELLANGEDASLPMGFEVGAHGSLDGWPTLRVFLLDLLYASDPDQSLILAREELSKTRSAEEFAVALRCLVRTGPGQASNDELVSHFSRMLAEPAWRKSAGLAEALDLARVIGTAEAAKHLLSWSGEPELKRMAMDEFAAEHPAQMVEALFQAEIADPTMRADLMARIDPLDPIQLGAVDGYLRNPNLSAEESTAFLKMFPLRSATTGNRLYGERPAPYSKEAVAAGDQAALVQVERWLTDPSLEKQRVELKSLHDRLSTWVEQAR
jgi:hypothetical protein